ncbi:MAG: DNA translocase FtsK [Candidatus Omnitrophica bacterium]|nr:DNA translocase FtsK [Candidatus Omnitrophota bacterium]
MQKEKKNEVISILLLTLGVFLFLSLITFNENDIPLYSANPNVHARNVAGFIGAYTAGILLFIMGIAAYVFPILCIIWGINRFFKTTSERISTRIAGTVILILTTSTLGSLIIDGSAIEEYRWGGTFGFFLSKVMMKYFGSWGSYIVLGVLLVASMILATEFMIFPALVKIKVFIAAFFKNMVSRISLPKIPHPAKRRVATTIQRREDNREAAKDKAAAEAPKPIIPFSRPKEVEVTIHKVPKPKLAKPEKAVTRPAAAKKSVDTSDYKLPPLDLLDAPPPIEERKIRDDLKTNSEVLEATLLDFDIEAKVVKVEQGPVITRYELEPAPGVKISKITALSDNISLVMKAQSVRIVAPIPGKGTIGVEVPNSSSSIVYLREVFDSDEFKDSSCALPLALGKDITGKAVVADLGDMPHLLIAGTTGSGKTVCVNSLIMSMLFRMRPDEVKFLMVDPKMVELAVFNGLPHLVCPIVTDAKKAAASLNWVVNEMERRYKLLAKIGARNIDAFNEKIKKNKEEFQDDEGRPMGKLPYMAVIIDELADLMMVARDSIENAITRLAQLSRAVGIHIILATQRPSVDVITGVIKANFPARVSFKVASKVDSRTVLDMNGADKLLGRGDMLFIEPGAHKPVRAQGSLISDNEIERIVEFIKSQSEASYDEDIMSLQEKKATAKTFEKDELFDEAVKLVFQTKQASVSMLQRKLGLGYTRAARLIDAMEDEGLVGPYRGSKPREILVEANDSKEIEG